MRRPAAASGRSDALAAGVTGLASLLLLLAVPVLAGFSGETASPALASAGWWWLIGVLAAQSVTIAMARAFPVTAVLAVTAVPLLAAWPAQGDAFGLTSLPVAVTVYRAAVAHPLTRLRVALALAVLVFAGAYATNQLLEPTGIGPGQAVVIALVQAVLVIGGPLIIALLVAARRAAREAQREELRALARERDAIVQAAIATQRTTMARELHDIAAHHLSGLALMAAAVDRQIETDPPAARAAVQQIRAQSTEVLDDLRRLVGLLREDGGNDGPATVAAIPELVEQLSANRSPIQLRVLGPGSDEGGARSCEPSTRLGASSRELGARLGPAAHLTAYRMVQESLTNAERHAAGAARMVEVDDRDTRAMVITVRNAPAAAAAAPGRDGFGLRGMLERAELIGAELSYGPVVDGGWQVQLTIPRTSAPEAT